MATTTHRIAVTETAYTNVSNGNLNCTVVNGKTTSGSSSADQNRLSIRPITLRSASSGMAAAQDLEAEDDIWVRAENGPMDVMVIRGPARITLRRSG